MRATVLITGALGFVGKALCNEMSNRKITIAPIRLSHTDPENLAAALRHCSTVVHLSARVHVMQDTALNPLLEYRLTNVDTTLILARQAATNGVRRFVFVSSVKVNGENTVAGQYFSEDDKPVPEDAYGISKMEAEQGLRLIATETDMEVVIIRPPLVYGPGVKANFAMLIRAVQRGWVLPLGSVHNKRSLVALINLVDFIIHCTTHPYAANQTFLVSDDVDISTSDLVCSVARALGRPARLLPIPVPILQIAGQILGRTKTVDRLCNNLQVDISKARNLLNWKPVITMDEALRQCVSLENS